MADFYFNDRNWKPIVGDSARALVEKTNDRGFLSPDSGVVAVSKDRWLVAQDAERNGWMNVWSGARDDRNQEHFEAFDRYAALAGRRYESAIEIGCGPFTNLRYIAGAVEVGGCTLLDPLLDDYLQHPHCAYDRRQLRLQSGGSVPVNRLVAAPVEEFATDETFDLVVMINVIEHCFDVEAIFRTLLRISRPGTAFVFHDRYYDHRRVVEMCEHVFDAGHPLKADGRVIGDFLSSNFDEKFCRPWDRKPGVYFIGTRRG